MVRGGFHADVCEHEKTSGVLHIKAALSTSASVCLFKSDQTGIALYANVVVKEN